MDPDKRLGANGAHEAASRPFFMISGICPKLWLLKAGEISEHDIFEPWDVVFAFQTFQRDPF